MSHSTAQRAPATARRRSTLALSTALLLGACGGAEVLLIPLFEFGFAGTTGAPPNPVQLQVFFLPDTPTEPSGSFDTVNMNIDDVQVQYTGTYSGCEFTLSTSAAVPAPAAPRYTGRFNGNDRIELTPAVAGPPVLTLQRLFAGTRATGC